MENYTLIEMSDESKKKEDKNLGRDLTLELFAKSTSVKLDDNAICMYVKTGSKVSNLTSFAFRNLEKPEIKQITWNGSGDALNKVIACAEITKDKFKNLYQINKIGFIKQEDYWKSEVEELRDIKVTKEIPAISILLSKTPLDPNESGYQTNESIVDLLKIDGKRNSNKKASSSSESRNNNNNNNTSKRTKNEQGVYVRGGEKEAASRGGEGKDGNKGHSNGKISKPS